MKKIFYLILLTSLLACGNRRREIPVANNSNLPSFNLLLMDSITNFNTGNIAAGKPTILMYVSPECEHCLELTKDLIKNINSLKGIQIYLFSPLPFHEVKQYYDDFQLGDYKNITVGNDYQAAFYKIYNATSFPCTAIFDKEKKLVRFYTGEININRVVEATQL